MKIDIKRGSINAANSIINEGLKKYFDDGIRFGYFDSEEDPNEICRDVIKNLEEYNEPDLVNKLKEIVNQSGGGMVDAVGRAKEVSTKVTGSNPALTTKI